MSSNHESFLKLIGMDNSRSEEAVVEPAEPGALNQEPVEQVEPAEAGVVHQESEFVEEAQAWDTPAPEAQADEWPVEPEIEQPMAEEYVPEAEVEMVAENSGSWTEQSVTEEEIPGLTEPSEATAVYTSQDSILAFDRTEILERLTQTQKTQPRNTKSYDPTRGKSQNTRQTMIFDYEADLSVAGTGTAHFDYSANDSAGRFVMLEGKANAQAFHLNALPLKLGRDPENHVILDDVNCSRFHAEVREAADGVQIVDLGSTNGVKVNGALVTEQILQPHDVIQMGDSLFEYCPAGALSKGKPKASATVTSDAQVSEVIALPSVKRKRMIKWAAGFLIVTFAAVVAMQYSSGLQKAAQQKAQDIVISRVESEVAAVRSQLTQNSQQDLADLSDAQVQEAFLKLVQSSSLSALIPEAQKEQINSLHPAVMRAFLKAPALISDLAMGGGNLSALTSGLHKKLQQSLQERIFSDSLIYSSALVVVAPEQAEYADAHEKIKDLVAARQAASAKTTMSEDEKKFYEYMEQHDNKATEMMDTGKTQEAIEFHELVIVNLQELMRQDARFTKVATEEIDRWTSRMKNLEQRLAAQQERRREQQAAAAVGGEQIDRMALALDTGNMAEASKLINDFLKQYPDHPRRVEVELLQAQFTEMVDRSFATTRETIERLTSANAYEAAWRELYRFMDLVPGHKKAKEMRDYLMKLAQPRATQFYNQARVFEYEADDLVAAEQYYKRTLETADPRSDLAEKASRRYAEVRRRSIQ
jgi:tetratricopeptide (TPR) repeat protein